MCSPNHYGIPPLERLRKPLNAMPHLISYLIGLTWVLTIGAGPLRADPEQVYALVSHFDGYTIGVNFEENPHYGTQQGRSI